MSPYETRPPQTHCYMGHTMEGDNVIVTAAGYRRCRECLRRIKRGSAHKRYWERKSQETKP